MKSILTLKVIPFALLYIISTAVNAQEYLGWTCSNDIQVMCNANGCEVAQGENFTPVNVHLLNDGTMDICAYSGCWSGKGTVAKDGGFTIFSGKGFTFSSPPDSTETEDIMIVIDMRDNVAVMKNSIFAQPLNCTKLVKQNAVK